MGKGHLLPSPPIPSSTTPMKLSEKLQPWLRLLLLLAIIAAIILIVRAGNTPTTTSGLGPVNPDYYREKKPRKERTYPERRYPGDDDPNERLPPDILPRAFWFTRKAAK